MRDLLVIGGGPVGLATSLYAAQLGLTVTVLEPRLGSRTPKPHMRDSGTDSETTPATIDKACGEGIMPGGLQALTALGVDPIGMPIKGICYVSKDRLVSTAFSAGPGRGVRRTVLHEALLQATQHAGVDLIPLTATGLEQHERGVRVTTQATRGRPGPALNASYLVAADGLHSPTRRTLGLEAAPPRHSGRPRYGLRQHSGIRPWSDHVEVHWADLGEAYVTPVAPDVVGVAILTDRRGSFDVLLRSFPELCDRLDRAPVVSDVRGAGPFRQKAIRRVAGRVLLVGDASGYVDALTGEGIGIGLAQAREAVRALAAADPEAYEAAWRRVTWRGAALTNALVQTTRPALGRRLIVPVAQRIPWVFRWAVDELARPR